MFPTIEEAQFASNPVEQFLLGAKFFFAGLRLLFRQRQLLLLSLVPLALTLVMLMVLALFFAWVVGSLLIGIADFLAAFFGQPQAVSPQLQLTLQTWAFLLGLFLACMFYLPLARVLLAPFSEALSRKTHEVMHAGVPYQSSLGWARAMFEGLKLVTLQLLILLAAFVLSLGLPIVGQFCFLTLTIVICGLDYLDVPLSARGLSLREKLGLLWQHKALTCGFAVAAYLLLLVPLVNLLALPVGVVGATLLTDQLHRPAGASKTEIKESV